MATLHASAVGSHSGPQPPRGAQRSLSQRSYVPRRRLGSQAQRLGPGGRHACWARGAKAPAPEAEAEGDAPAADSQVVDVLKDPKLRREVKERAREVLGDKVAEEDLDFIVERLAAGPGEGEAEGGAALAAAEAELATLRAQHLRLSADFDNFRKRTDGEKVALRERVRGDVVEQLFPLVDSFEQAKSQLKVETEAEQKIEGAYQGLYKQMLDIFKGLGVEPVPGEGQPFDPALHDGIMRTEDDSVPDGTILKEFRRGFVLGGQLLRPAMVQVSFSNAAGSGSGSQEGAAAAEASAQ